MASDSICNINTAQSCYCYLFMLFSNLCSQTWNYYECLNDSPTRCWTNVCLYIYLYHVSSGHIYLAVDYFNAANTTISNIIIIAIINSKPIIVINYKGLILLYNYHHLCRRRYHLFRGNTSETEAKISSQQQLLLLHR